MNVYRRYYPEVDAGGFTRADGTIPFYERVNALLRPEMTVLEFGAGRGRGGEDPVPFRRQLLTLRGKVRDVIGLDVDPVVLENPMVDRALVFDGETIPLDDGSVDLVLSDWVFEHLPDPARSAAELYRVLKPGGWICARTPYKYSLIVTGSRLVPNALHARALNKIQPGERQSKDIFPTVYRLNTHTALKKHFNPAMWDHYSYTDSPTPSYHFGSPIMVRLLSVVQYLKHPIAGEILMIFMRKKEGAVSASTAAGR
jgi:SAM-dependent methyltransferase